jgi:hypothetical protein
MKDISFENIGLSCAAKSKNPLKQIHLVSGVPFVVIDKRHAQRLGICYQNDTWVEQIPVEDGILMKVRRNDKDQFLAPGNCVGKIADNQMEDRGI